MLEIENLCCSYGKVNAVKGISLTVKKGELVALVGANGAGKSTTLRALSGLISPTRGTIRYEGQNITGNTPRSILSKGIAHCPEGRHVFPEMTVEENLALGSYLRRASSQVESDMRQMFKRFPILEERKKQPAGLMSGGEQQMLAIARALMSRPRLVLFDEPSLGLAPAIIDRVFDLITEIRNEGMTVLMVEQNAYAALEMCDHAYLIEAGVIKKSGSGKALLEDPQVREAYLGG
ncbi:ABC transporter ATP-binding protein [Mesorhizobium sp. CO1-1-8]|uniref:ABC transporter ATP-binding protein n=1 Tax=Mesorhizobium sp. CO1-1-8 TaxID=2876631 RepID=UPI001CD182C4|nr:ABC transporter ATP-binding protein [Mesorhizobium sp. CO1-1-8]MBZ9772576.1 ABC transporter ATP-binding protein [Mesorhizobium sp. CO1-1-8]